MRCQIVPVRAGNFHAGIIRVEMDSDVKEQPWAQVRMITTKGLCYNILLTLESEVSGSTHYNFWKSLHFLRNEAC